MGLIVEMKMVCYGIVWDKMFYVKKEYVKLSNRRNKYKIIITQSSLIINFFKKV